MSDQFNAEAFNKAPLIAILRGITPDEASDVCTVLADAGFYFVEVTLDSPDWEASLRLIKQQHSDRLLLGAGTVLTPQDVDRVHASGGRAIISPNMSPDVIRRSKEKNLLSIPGCYTPSECFNALAAGADWLKIFPTSNAAHLKAISTVLPAQTRLCPTGGVNVDNVAAYLKAGAYAAGIGAALYSPNIALSELAARAQKLIAAVRG